ncbi:MAG: sugar phosphate isomerase/epimerase family protein [Acidimicrobiales bacterium]
MSDALPRPVALQLYTLRELAATDFPSVLRLAGEIGFAGVEPAGLHGMAAHEVRRILDDLGLVVSSTHGPIPDDPEAAAELADHVTLGSPAVFPSLHQEWFASTDAVERAADRFARGAEAANEVGLELGYHNHWWEFTTILDGRSAYAVFLDALGARGISPLLEVDLYWAKVGGADPAELIASLGPSVRYLHVKDGPGTIEAPMTALGTGVVDLPAALQANHEVRWHVVELDRCATDMVEAVRSSYVYLTGGGFSVGAPRTAGG